MNFHQDILDHLIIAMRTGIVGAWVDIAFITFAVRLQNAWILQNVTGDNVCPDDTVHMHMMI